MPMPTRGNAGGAERKAPSVCGWPFLDMARHAGAAEAFATAAPAQDGTRVGPPAFLAQSPVEGGGAVRDELSEGPPEGGPGPEG
jgi:hypothetical protein